MNTVPFEHRTRYTHLSKDDTAVWNKFIRVHPDAYAQVVYDLRVGEGDIPAPGTPPNYAEMIEKLSQKRVDVVALLPDQTHIIEVKPHASLSACGQILVYKHLFDSQFPELLPSRMLIVCYTADRDILDFCSLHSIEVITLS